MNETRPAFFYAYDIFYLLHTIKHVLPWYARTSPDSTQALSSKYTKCARIMISDVLFKLGGGFILISLSFFFNEILIFKQPFRDILNVLPESRISSILAHRVKA